MPEIPEPEPGRTYEPTPLVAKLYGRTAGAISRGIKRNCRYYVAEHEGRKTYWWDMQDVRAYMPYMKRPVRSHR